MVRINVTKAKTGQFFGSFKLSVTRWKQFYLITMETFLKILNSCPLLTEMPDTNESMRNTEASSILVHFQEKIRGF